MQMRLVQQLLKITDEPDKYLPDAELKKFNLYLYNKISNYTSSVKICDHDFTIYGQNFQFRNGVYYIKSGTIKQGTSVNIETLRGGIYFDRLHAASDDIYMMGIETLIFNRIANKILRERAQVKSQFLVNIPAFSNMMSSQLNKFANRCTRLKFKHKDIVFAEGQPATYAYIILKGEFTLEQSLTQPSQDSILGMLQSSKTKYLQGNLFTRKFSEIENCQPTKLKLGIYCRGSVTGEDDILSKNKTYTSSLKCLSEGGAVY